MEDSNQIIEAAKIEAERIVNEAKIEAKNIIEGAISNKQDLKHLLQELGHLNKERNHIINTLQSNTERFGIKDDWDLKAIREHLKRLNKSHEIYSYCELTTSWEIRNGSTILSESSLRKLINIAILYCDSLIGNILVDVNKKGLSQTIREASNIIESVEKLIPWEIKYQISEEYIERKKKQIELVYEIEEYKVRKKEEQRLLKEQQREEAAAQREFERELKKAQKDQDKAQEALRKAQEEAEKEKENTDKFNKLQEQIASLQAALEEARQRSERVMSMAQQTRQGWVYIISNIGSFGENVYKIGMTRRLDPMERVAELGDASVPFPFDVHAMIFSEDAPALETALHQAFEGEKTNLVNGKKEFFNVPLSSIKEKVKELGYDVTFEDNAIAPQYRDTLFARRQN